MKKTTILFLFGLLLAQLSVFSQQEDLRFSKVFYEQYNGFHVLASVKAGQDSLMMINNGGPYSGSGGVQLMDGEGEFHWLKSPRRDGADLIPIDIIRTADQNFLICINETSYSSSKNAILLAKINLEGEIIWVKKFEDEMGTSASGMVLSASGDILITGHAKPNLTNNDKGLLLLRISSEGVLLWAKTYSTPMLRDRGIAVAELTTGELVVGGLAKGDDEYSNEISIIKTDADGNLLWAKQKLPSGLYKNTLVNDLLASPDGFYLSGSDVSDGATCISFNGDGESIWSIALGEVWNNYDESVYRGRMALASDGDLLLSYGGGLACRLDSANGAFIWSYLVFMQQLAIQQLSDGGYIFIGVGPLIGVKDVYEPQTGIVRTNAMGESLGCLEDIILDQREYFADFAAAIYTVETLGTMTDYSFQWVDVSLNSFDGCVDILGALEESSDATNALTVYPNPGKEPFRLMQEELQPESQVQLLVYNSKGQVILNREGVWSELQLVEKQLSAGIYLIQLRTKIGVFATRLVVE
ncbi:MAG: T9SS type A sorting domain-containing protein [Bacteroidales bacterium]|nr:T9SS type A sorting domain-containing protein [Bacteroidales bacterium]